MSKTSLWATPLACGLFLAIVALVDLLISVPPFVYWIVIAMCAFTWIGDLISVVLRRVRRQP